MALNTNANGSISPIILQPGMPGYVAPGSLSSQLNSKLAAPTPVKKPSIWSQLGNDFSSALPGHPGGLFSGVKTDWNYLFGGGGDSTPTPAPALTSVEPNTPTTTTTTGDPTAGLDWAFGKAPTVASDPAFEKFKTNYANQLAAQQAAVGANYTTAMNKLAAMYPLAETAQEKATLTHQLADLQQQKAAGLATVANSYLQGEAVGNKDVALSHADATASEKAMNALYNSAVAKNATASKAAASDPTMGGGLGGTGVKGDAATIAQSNIAADGKSQAALAKQLGDITAQDIAQQTAGMAQQSADQQGALVRGVTGLANDDQTAHDQQVSARIANSTNALAQAQAQALDNEESQKASLLNSGASMQTNWAQMAASAQANQQSLAQQRLSNIDQYAGDYIKQKVANNLGANNSAAYTKIANDNIDKAVGSVKFNSGSKYAYAFPDALRTILSTAALAPDNASRQQAVYSGILAQAKADPAFGQALAEAAKNGTPITANWVGQMFPGFYSSPSTGK